jgi:hypothetical protein
MDYNPYEMIFKRKSVRKYDKNLKVSDEELELIMQKLKILVPYDENIRTAFTVVPNGDTSCGRGEYCLVGYSEKKGDYLLNMGYMLEQIDLFLPSINVGACWQGLSKPDTKTLDGLDYVILLSFGKAGENTFQSKNSFFKRKKLDEIWEGDFYKPVGEVVRLSPSAINWQPWRVKAGKGKIEVYRTSSLFPLYPKAKMHFFNTIDLGIFCYILEVCLKHEGLDFERVSPPSPTEGLIPVATYLIKE